VTPDPTPDEQAREDEQRERDERDAAMGARIEALSRTLTGWDEIAIEKAFDRPITRLSATMTSRALVFVLLRRHEQEKDGKAHWRVMEMPIGEIESYFDGSRPELDPKAASPTA
jgi:hypothetical protein